MSTSSSVDLARTFLRRLAPLDLWQWLGVVVLGVLLAHASGHIEPGFLNRIDALLYDARVRLLARAEPDPRIAIVDIDERSLAELGRWPWNRARLADLVDSIFRQHGALLLGLDVILAEPDESSGLASLDTLGRGPLRHNDAFQAALAGLRPQLDYDGRLAAVFRRYPVVLGFHLSSGAGAASSGELPPPLSLGAGEPAGQLTRWTGYGANLPRLQLAAGAAGFLNAPIDPDGVTRRALLLARHDDKMYAALSLVMTQILLGNPPLQLRFAEPPAGSTGSGTLEALELLTVRGALRIAVDEQAGVLLPFRGPVGSFAYHSAVDVLAGRVPVDSLRGRVVLLGTTAPGLLDQRVTPVGEAYPGVEAHANLLSGLLAGNLPQSPAYTPGVEVLGLLFVGTALLLGLPRFSPAGAVLLAMSLLVVVVASNLAAWVFARLALPMAAILLLVAMLLALHLFFGYFVEHRAKRRLTELFGQYVPPELVEEMNRDPTHYSMEGRSSEMTVLFADVRGFTTLAEGMPPDELARLMNDYFSVMTDIIRAHRSTLDKYVGDALVAFWGAPLADAQHARHAVEAGLAMQAALIGVNQRFASRAWPSLRVGIGINTGTMVVGDMGSRHRRSYTVLGDAVNLASRLEGLSAQYGAGVIIGEATYQALGEWRCRQLDRVTVRGRTTPVAIYEPL